MADPHRSEASESGLGSSLRGLGNSLLALLRVRAELLGIELAEEKERLRATLILAVVAAIFLALAVQVLSFLVIVVCWDTYRLQAIVGVVVVYVLIAALAAWWIRRLWRTGAPPFAATLLELRNDLEAMQRRDEH
jgi:uncharacterized membrane protein YqjE